MTGALNKVKMTNEGEDGNGLQFGQTWILLGDNLRQPCRDENTEVRKVEK